MNSKKCVLLLCGGRSPEHPISVRTARNVLEAIDREHYEVFLVGITGEGQWVYIPDRRFTDFLEQDGDGLEYIKPSQHTACLLSGPYRGARAVLAEANSVVLAGSGTPAADTDMKVRKISAVDVVFPLLHGPYGEDGIVQGFLDTLGVAYVGSGVLASAVGMDKQFMKIVFEAAGIQVSPYVAFHGTDYSRYKEKVFRTLRLPVFVKPARAGSSFGITRVDDFVHLEAAVKTASRFDVKVIVEQGFTGQEIEVAVLQGRGGQAPRVTVPGEIVVGDSDKVYDFNSKYLGRQKTKLLIPARIDDAVADAVQERASKAFEAIEAQGLSRVDFFYTDDGAIILNEINTMPGFTEISMYPKLWEASGLTYSELIDELIALALEK